MSQLLYNIGQVLGITIIHSLWQGLLIYVVLRIIFLSAPSLSAIKRYNLLTVALLSIVAWFACTFYTECDAYDWTFAPKTHAATFITGLPFHAVAHADLKSTLYNAIKTYLPYISVLYLIGLIINLSKLGVALNKIRVIKKGMIAADTLQHRCDEFSRKLNIPKRVQVSFSRLVDVPCVIGYIKPILLLPITLTFQLTTEEIETILLHELSHIKNNDYLLNLVQQLIAVTLFFNPFAQLINKMISVERENRCDDLVVATSGNPLTYAYALLKLEEARQTELKLALAATQNKNHLLTRIERIMKTKQPIGNIRHIVLAVILFAGSLSSIAWLNPEIKSGKIAIKNTAHNIYAAVTTIKNEVTTPKVIAHKAKKPSIFSYAIDTTRQTIQSDTNKKKIKIIVEDENGNKKEYNSVNDMPASVKKDFYKENGDAHFDFKYNFNDSTSFKYFNSPEWKKQTEAMAKMGAEFGKKYIDNPQFKKQMAEMERKAAEMDKKANSPEFKKQVDDMAKKAAEMAKNYDSPEFKKQVEELAKSGAEMAKMYDSPQFKKQIEEMARMGAEMGKGYVNSPEFKKMQEELTKSAEEMAKQYSKSDFNFKYDYQVDKEKAEKKEKKEKKEKVTVKKNKVEKVEKKEKPEQPEKPESPENPGNNN